MREKKYPKFKMENYLIDDFPSKLKFLRVLKNIPVSTICEHLDVSKTTVSNWETGLRVPRLEHISKLSEVLDEPVSTFIKDKSTIEFIKNYRLEKNKQQQIEKTNNNKDSEYVWSVPMAAYKTFEGKNLEDLDIILQNQPEIYLYQSGNTDEKFFGYAQLDDSMLNTQNLNKSIPIKTIVICTRNIEIEEKISYLAVIKYKTEVMLREIKMVKNKIEILSYKDQKKIVAPINTVWIIGIGRRLIKKVDLAE